MRYKTYDLMPNPYTKTYGRVCVVVNGIGVHPLANRTGLTGKVGDERAVYKWQGAQYVYEDGWLIPIEEWKER